MNNVLIIFDSPIKKHVLKDLYKYVLTLYFYVIKTEITSGFNFIDICT